MGGKHMKTEEKIKLFNDVFEPKSGEKILFLVDIPHDNIQDNENWKDRRKMAKEWYTTFKEMGNEKKFTVYWMEFPATGLHNYIIPKKFLDIAQKMDLVIAMTEFSATSSLIKVAHSKGSKTRCTSMPNAERRMEKTAFRADYKLVYKYATAIEKILKNKIAAEIKFSTGDKLYIDLRNRNPKIEAGDCTSPGKLINFPSGEAWISPYEGAPDEVDIFGESKTEGIWPVDYSGELVKFVIKHNKIVEIKGNGENADKMRKIFNEIVSRRNIAELGIGCNPQAVVSGNPLEDEKVSGLHIAYGMSDHLGGKVKSDIHVDISYPKDAPIEATTLTLIDKEGNKTELIKNSKLQYKLLVK
jgi:leucyl aminopeptidase (aminopeptidase T)